MQALRRIARRVIVPPLQQIDRTYRRLSAGSRRLPEAIIIGAQKCGTSSLFAYMAQHPLLLPSSAKEVHYFDGGLDPADDNFAKGEAWYRAHFDRIASSTAGSMAFEASPLYLFNPDVPERIHAALPEARLIVLLRDPVERAISHYFHESRLGWEDLPIMQAFEAEDERTAAAWAAQDFKSVPFIHHTYKARGRYAEQLARYFALFGRERVFVSSSEAFFSDPEATLEAIFRFLGIDPGFRISAQRRWNVGGNRTDVDAEVYRYLEDYFAEPNRELFDALGQRLDWRPAAAAL